MSLKKAKIIICCLVGLCFVLVLLGIGLDIAALGIAGVAVSFAALFFSIKYWCCPSCGRHLGRGGGKYCRHCGNELAEWAVTYEGGGRGRAGREVRIGRTFSWGQQSWYVPAVYACKEGLVVELLMEAEPGAVRSFVERWELHRERGRSYTKEEIQRMEREHPLNVGMRPGLVLNGELLQRAHGMSNSYIPASCLPPGVEQETGAKDVLEHYGLDLAKPWAVWRWSFSYAENARRRPRLRQLRLIMEREREQLPAGRFATPKVGGSARFAHPLTGVEHTLTVQGYALQSMEQRLFADPKMEYPTHFAVMEYTLLPDADHLNFMVKDCAEGDAPRHRQPGQSRLEPEAACSAAVIGIIGGANGPTALVPGSGGERHAACSSLHFEPGFEPVEWEPVFFEKLVADMEIELLGGNGR